MPLDPDFKFSLNDVEAKLDSKLQSELAEVYAFQSAGDYAGAEDKFKQSNKYVKDWESLKGFFDWLMT